MYKNTDLNLNLKMKAVICTKYGNPEVLEIKEVEKPKPKSTELLIKIHYTTVHIGDTKIRKLEPGMGKWKDLIIKTMMRILIGFTKPRKKILGMEFSGVIEDVGKNTTKFKIGDLVFGSTQLNFGTYAEYCCVSENSIISTLPKNMSLKETAPLSNASITALYYLRKAKISKGKKVLIYGASGSVGTYAIQIAKYFKTTVTGVCSDKNIEMVKSLSANKVINYKTENFTENNETYDIIFDAVGKIPLKKRKISLSDNGIYVNVMSDNFKMKIEDLDFIKEICEKGELKTQIDKVYTLEQIVDAHKYVDKGHKKGNVIINIKEHKYKLGN